MGLRIPTPGEALACMSAGGANSEAPALWDGLAGLWMPQSAAGGRWLDLSGKGIHGTLMNSPTWGVGPFGKQLAFDGLTQYVTLGDNLDLTTGALTVSISGICTDFTRPANAPILDKFYDGSKRSWLLQLASGNAAQLVLSNAAGTASTTLASTALGLSTGVRFHLAVTWSMAQQNAAFYVNGKFVELSAATHTVLPYNNTAPLFFGSDYNLDDNWEGVIDYVGLWSRTLVSSEVARIGTDPMAIVRRRPIQIAVKAPAAPGGANIPAIMHHYKQMRRAC